MYRVMLSTSLLPTISCSTNERRKSVLYGELTAGNHNIGRPQLLDRDVCKWDMNELNIYLNKREEFAMDCSKWRNYLQVTLNVFSKIIVLDSR